MSKKLGITVIGFNRLEGLKRLLERLNRVDYQGDDVTLIISIDYHVDNKNVVDFARQFVWNNGKKHVVNYAINLGLRKHILTCGSYMEKYDLDAMAVFEDDIYPALGYYEFMKQTVDFYCDDMNIAGISLYKHGIDINSKTPFIPIQSGYDVFFMQVAQSWGQVWMRRQWEEFYRWYLENQDSPFDSNAVPKRVCEWPESSWLKYHMRYCEETNKYFVYPYKSLTTCYNDIGTHNKDGSSIFQVPLQVGEGYTYRFIKCDENAIRYNVFFENENVLGVLDEDIRDNTNVSFHEYQIERGKRYILSTALCDYKCVKHWDSRMLPLEMNVLLGNEGDGIWLYDSFFFEPRKKEYNLKVWIYLKKINKKVCNLIRRGK